jgi:hypothetical protein
MMRRLGTWQSRRLPKNHGRKNASACWPKDSRADLEKTMGPEAGSDALRAGDLLQLFLQVGDDAFKAGS